MFDGTLARATGRVSKLGAFYDSVFDRAGEVIVYIGLVVGLQELGILNGTVFAAAAMGSAVLVSYTRSKSEGLGFTSGSGMAADRVHDPGGPTGRPQRRARPGRPDRDESGQLVVPRPARAPWRCRPARSSSSWPSASSPWAPSSPSSSGSCTSARKPDDNPPSPNGARRTNVTKNGQQRQERLDTRQYLGRVGTSRRRQDPGRDRRRRQLREQPRPGPLLLRERQGRRLRPRA